MSIETRALSWRGGSFRLEDMDLNVPSGSIYGFLGPNGSGKTTTIRLLMGMMKPAGGRITMLGDPVPEAMPRILARTGYVPEVPHLYPALTVGETLAYHRSFWSTWSDGHADSLVRRFGLDRGQRVSSLSKGETGQLLVLLALAQRPELLVLDEPTDGLDPVVRRELFEALLAYVAETGATVFVSSHLVHELERVCDRVGVLDEGRLVAELPMAEFKGGIKRLRVVDPPTTTSEAPFVVLDREPAAVSGETWTVRGWEDRHRSWLEGAGATLREVVDLDLEEAFVELLRTARQGGEEA